MTFNLVLDEPTENDFIHKINELQVIVDNALIELYKGFTISSVQYGPNSPILFRVVPDEQLSGGGCDSCSSCG